MLLLVISGCGSKAASGTTTVTAQVPPVTVTETVATSSMTASSTTATAPTTSSVESSAADTAPAAVPVGSTQTIPTNPTIGVGGRATVYAVDQAVPPSQFDSDAGLGTAMDIEVCVDAPGKVSAAPWTVTDGSNGRYKPDLGAMDARKPEYPNEYQPVALNAGECVRGWLTMDVPSGTQLTSVRYTLTDQSGFAAVLLVWSI